MAHEQDCPGGSDDSHMSSVCVCNYYREYSLQGCREPLSFNLAASRR
jgi:hypothetical protein